MRSYFGRNLTSSLHAVMCDHVASLPVPVLDDYGVILVRMKQEFFDDELKIAMTQLSKIALDECRGTTIIQRGWRMLQFTTIVY